MWILFAFGSALFAGLTSVLAKCGIKKADSDAATAIRTIVVLIFSWLMVWIVGSAPTITGSHERKCRLKSRSGCARRSRSLRTALHISTGNRISMTRYCPESVRMSATLSAPKMTEKSLRQFAAIKRSPGKAKAFPGDLFPWSWW